MKKLILFAGFLILYGMPAISQHLRKFHMGSLLIDTHNDILTTICDDSTVNIDRDMTGKTHSDIARFRKGGVDVQFFSVWCDGNKKNPFSWANREIDSLYAIALRNWNRMEVAFTYRQVNKLHHKRRFTAMIGVEGGHMIENKLNNLDSLFRRGTRYMTLTWNNSTPWATSAMDETQKKDSLPHKGLTDFGKQVVQRMNELGMIVDVSHVGEQTFWDVMAVTSKPVIASHSCSYTLCPVFRNLKDEQIKAIAKNDGVISLNFFSGFLDSNFFKKSDAFNKRHKQERDSVLKTNDGSTYLADAYLFAKYRDEVEALRPPLSLLIDHIDYIVRLAGIDHVGLGSDFDGITSAPRHLDDVASYPEITKALLARGYSKKDTRKILGQNMLRVIRQNLTK